MGDVQFSEQDLAFLNHADNTLTLRCLCQYQQHEGFCNEEAAVTIKFHLPHVCRTPALVEYGRVDENGCVTQFLCTKCYWEARQWVEAKIAQTLAAVQQMSSMCCHCGYVLRVHSRVTDEWVTFDVCPRCHTDRIEFRPVCGAGVADANGRTHGCGQPLAHYSDIIRSEEWLIPNREGTP